MPAIVVVGASGGLGQAICRCLASADFRVFITYRSSRRTADALAASLPSGACLGVGAVDVTDRDSVAKLQAMATKSAGTVSGLVYASGANIDQPLAGDASPQEWRDVIETELMGLINVVHAFLGPFRAQRHGAFVSVVTFANYSFPIGDALSSVPKAGMEALMRALAKEEGPHGIRANCVAPGIINAGLGAKFQETLYGKDVWEKQERRVPLRRFGEAEDVAQAVAFLMSERARYITGCTLLVDGGLHL